MSYFTLDILLCCSAYLIMVWVIWREKRKNRRENDNTDDEGGITIPDEPILDLPPGVILPLDSPVKERELIEH